MMMLELRTPATGRDIIATRKRNSQHLWLRMGEQNIQGVIAKEADNIACLYLDQLLINSFDDEKDVHQS